MQITSIWRVSNAVRILKTRLTQVDKNFSSLLCLFSCQCHLHILICIHTFSHTGKWHRNFFTHADVIELLEAMQGMGIASSRDLFFSIVTSVCPTQGKTADWNALNRFPRAHAAKPWPDAYFSNSRERAQYSNYASTWPNYQLNSQSFDTRWEWSQHFACLSERHNKCPPGFVCFCFLRPTHPILLEVPIIIHLCCEFGPLTLTTAL